VDVSTAAAAVTAVAAAASLVATAAMPACMRATASCRCNAILSLRVNSPLSARNRYKN
jgi:hypothetical protein